MRDKLKTWMKIIVPVVVIIIGVVVYFIATNAFGSKEASS